MERAILHCDLNGFYASVEELFDPRLREVPMAVCGDPNLRHGIILAKNERAKAFGVRTAETIWQARRKCPGLVLVPARHEEYHKYSRLVNALYAGYTDQVEPFGIDESWLDVTGSRTLFGPARTIADELRMRVKRELDLTISVGVSFNKVFAKLGSDLKKPDATTEITRENFRRVVWPLKAQELLYVGKSAAGQLARAGIHTIGQIAQADQSVLEGLLGKSGHTMWEYANGQDDSPVRRVDEPGEVKSISNNITFRRNLVTQEDIKAGLLFLCESVGYRLRVHGYKCRTVQVQIKDPALKVIQRQRALSKPTQLTHDILDCALHLVQDSWPAGREIRMLSVAATQLTDKDDAHYQPSFFEDRAAQERLAKLERAVDHIRDRHGTGKLSVASLMASDLMQGDSDGEDKQDENE